MDLIDFWCQAFPPIIFIVEKGVYFDIWNKFFFTWIWLKKKIEPNHRGTFEMFEKILFIPNIHQNVHIFPPQKMMGENLSDPYWIPRRY